LQNTSLIKDTPSSSFSPVSLRNAFSICNSRIGNVRRSCQRHEFNPCGSVAEYFLLMAGKASTKPIIESVLSLETSSEALVVKVINSSERSIRLAAYSFTSPVVVRALLNAKRRGVDVRVVVDEKGNKSKASIAAPNLIANAGIPARTISSYAIHHDIYIISDEKHVQTGSFNFSKAAAKSNSENVIVV